jgi:pimeloyl-ACP methyl ester carboxylesterase
MSSGSSRGDLSGGYVGCAFYGIRHDWGKGNTNTGLIDTRSASIFRHAAGHCRPRAVCFTGMLSDEWPMPDFYPAGGSRVVPSLQADFPPGAVLNLLVDHFTADWRKVVPTVNVPSSVATGRYSPSFPIQGLQWFAGTLPDSYLSVFETSGHCPHWNEPEAFNRELLAFLTTTLR